MKTEAIKQSIALAKIYIDRANAVIKEREENHYLKGGGTQKSGALRRMSMELTNSLARVRKG